MNDIAARFLYLSEELNALDYLERAAVFIRWTESNDIAWKWVVLALHGALYGFAISACRGTNYENVLRKDGKLISFWEALRRCQDPALMKMTALSKHLQLTEQQKQSIKSLKHLLRNNFEHFTPKGWSIEIHGFPQITIDAFEVIRFLALETETYVHLDDQQRSLVDTLVSNSIGYLQQTQLYIEARASSS